MKRLFVSAALVLGISFAAPIVTADPAPSAGSPKAGAAEEPEWKMKARRQVLFDEGQRLLEQERPKAALAKFREVYALRAHPRVLLWMALAEEKLNHLLKARAIYGQAKTDAREAKLQDVEDDATKALRELAPRIPRIIVRVVPEIWFTVQVDSASVSPNDGRVDVEVGTHTIVISSPGQTSYSTEVMLRAGEQKIVRASLVPVAPPSEKAWGGCAGCAVGSHDADSVGGGLALLVLSLARRRRERRERVVRSARS